MTDLTGHPEPTPHKGGWCGNDVFPEALSPEHRERARVLTRKLGDRLAVEGYRGFLEIDYLAGVDTGELYLGEINPRISGVTPMTDVTAGAYADAPLFLFHLLEYLDVDVGSRIILEDKAQFVGEPIDGAAEPVPTGALAVKTA